MSSFGSKILFVTSGNQNTVYLGKCLDIITPHTSNHQPTDLPLFPTKVKQE